MRRTTRGLAAAAALWTILGIAGPAAAGGWWSSIPLRGAELGVGERFVTASKAVLFDSAEASARARGGEDRYFAYLIPSFDWGIVHAAMGVAEPRGWWVQPAVAIRAGEVVVTGGPTNLARVSVRFAVPEVAPGPYALMLCSEGCVQPLADIVPSEIEVFADPVAARTARALERARAGRARLAQRVQHVERELRALESRGTDQDLLDAIDALTARTRHAERELRATQRRAGELEGAAPAPAWILLGAAGGALLLFLSRRRRPRRGPPESPRPVEMELVEPPKELEPDRPPVPAA